MARPLYRIGERKASEREETVGNKFIGESGMGQHPQVCATNETSDTRFGHWSTSDIEGEFQFNWKS